MRVLWRVTDTDAVDKWKAERPDSKAETLDDVLREADDWVKVGDDLYHFWSYRLFAWVEGDSDDFGDEQDYFANV